MYLEGFTSVENVFEEFAATDVERGNVEILIAVYEQGSYEGDAWVLFRKEGKLYEVCASHCSCFGLEGQFDPEETDGEALQHRLENGSYFRHSSKEVVEEIGKIFGQK